MSNNSVYIIQIMLRFATWIEGIGSELQNITALITPWRQDGTKSKIFYAINISRSKILQ